MCAQQIKKCFKVHALESGGSISEGRGGRGGKRKMLGSGWVWAAQAWREVNSG